MKVEKIIYLLTGGGRHRSHSWSHQGSVPTP